MIQCCVIARLCVDRQHMLDPLDARLHLPQQPAAHGAPPSRGVCSQLAASETSCGLVEHCSWPRSASIFLFVVGLRCPPGQTMECDMFYDS